MKHTKNTITVKATESSWFRSAKFNEEHNVLVVTKLATRKTMRNVRQHGFWYCTREAFQELQEAFSKMGEGDSLGRTFNRVLQPLQGTEEAKAAIEAAKASN